MALMRAFSRVDEEGKLVLPANVRREVGLKPGQLVELKVVGANKARQLLLSKRDAAR